MHISVPMIAAYQNIRNLLMAATLSLIETTVQAFAFFYQEKGENDY